MTQRKMRTLSHERAAEDIEPDADELAADDVSQETVVATPAEDDDEVSLNAGQMLSSWILSYSKNTYKVTGPSKRNVNGPRVCTRGWQTFSRSPVWYF